MAFGGPALGPLCSSFIETEVGFRWNLRVMAIFSGFMSLLAAFVPETHGPTLLKWRIKQEGNAPPALSARQVVAVYKVALARPIVYLFTGEIISLQPLYAACLKRLATAPLDSPSQSRRQASGLDCPTRTLADPFFATHRYRAPRHTCLCLPLTPLRLLVRIFRGLHRRLLGEARNEVDELRLDL
jgi:hypothetical protein